MSNPCSGLLKPSIRSSILLLLSTLCAGAATLPITFTKLGGVTGGTNQGTAVFKADLSSVPLSEILSITIGDNSSGLGGATGQFSGFDLDAIVLSTSDCATAACVEMLPANNIFDFLGGIVFVPGVQRAPADPKLFGTGPGGNTVDLAVATPGDFDAENTAAIPGADGFVSMGDNGRLSFNLSGPLNPAGLFLYIGEVGDNGEVAAGQVTIADERVPDVPEPSTFALLASGLAVIAVVRKRHSH